MISAYNPMSMSWGFDVEFASHIGEVTNLGSLSADTLNSFRAAYPPPLTVPLSDAVVRSDHATGTNGPVVRVHRPVGATEPLPCLYWMHGGGLVMGNRLQDDIRFDSWCNRHQMVAVTVEYRLAPEVPYPGALDDCRTGLGWVVEHAAELGIDPARIAVGGVSAGGGLAAALALHVRDHGGPALMFQLLIYPMLDDRQVTPSSQANVPLWPPAANRFGWQSYLAHRWGTDEVDHYAAPARASDVTGLPPAYIYVGGLDGFLDECSDYANRLLHAGVHADLHVYPGVPHGFDGMAPKARVTRRAQRDVHEWLGHMLTPTNDIQQHDTNGGV